mmetsp:Transcript_34910/g.81677  ORF Transcript_34910/g.81677 Transcript_34910/m.81677 type:complete len:900 (+) Transcript_34910:80-2779(+)
MAETARGQAASIQSRKRKKVGSGESATANDAPGAEEALDKHGVFIRGLPQGTTDKEIQTLMESSIGPTSTCFVIRDDYGVARFRNEEDAQRCLEELQGVEMKGSALSFEAAKPKRKAPKEALSKTKQRPRAQGAAAAQDDDDEEIIGNEAAGGASSSSAAKSKRPAGAGAVHLRSVVIRGIPSSVAKDTVRQWAEGALPAGSVIEDVRRAFGEGGEEGSSGKDCSYVITFAKESIARRALDVLPDAPLDGRSVSVSLRAADKGMATSKAGRLIVRNLAFGATLKHIRRAFQQLGELKEVHIPPAPEGSRTAHRGFAFVQYADQSLAAKAVAELNGTKICGRGVAIDYAVDAMLYGSLQKQERDQQRKAASVLTGTAADEDDLVLETAPTHSAADALPRSKGKETEEDGEEDAEDEPAAAQEAGKPEDELQRMKRLLDDDSKAKEEKAEKKNVPSLPKRAPGFDLDKHCTVFVRNIPFDATQEDLSEVFRRFGPLKSVKFVMDKAGQNAHAGKAFIQYRDQAGAAAALADEARAEKKLKEMSALLKKKGDQPNDNALAVDGFGITLKGRRLVVKDALKPEEAEKIVEAKQDKKKKKAEEKEMWMHLLHMGEVKEGSPQWHLLSKSEQDQRKASAKERRFRSTNPNFAIHPERLSIRNLPKSVDSSKLRTAITDFLGSLEGVAPTGAGRARSRKAAQALIDKVQLVRDQERRDSENVRKSRGFAFVTFKDHKWAMSTLQHLNNNPEIFGGKKRPIVEFAIEDKRKIQMQKELFQKHAHKLAPKGEEGEDAQKKKHKNKHKESRGRKQREKRRAQKEQQQEYEAEKARLRATKAREVAKQEKIEAAEGLMEVRKRKPTAVPDARQTEQSSTKRFKQKHASRGELSDDFELRAMQRFREAGLA